MSISESIFDLAPRFQRRMMPRKLVSLGFAIWRRRLTAPYPRLRQVHLFVMGLRLTDDAVNRSGRHTIWPEAPGILFEIAEIRSETDPSLDAAVAVDEWKTGRPAMVQRLRDGARCFVAKHDRQVIASLWLTTADRFFDAYLGREFLLSDDESYSWGAHCVPAHRGSRVMSTLMTHAMMRLSREQGRRQFTILVRTSNKPSIRAARSLGFTQVGRAGFVEAKGLRWQYLSGRNAFGRTRRGMTLERAS